MKKYIYILILSLFVLTTCSKDESDPIVTKYSLTAQANPTSGGTVSPSSGTYNDGSKVTLTATPASNFEFKNWSGGASGTENPLSVTMNSNKSITAVFEEQPAIHNDGEGLVGSMGGIVRIQDSSSPINGAYINIPEGALSKDENIKISLAPDDVKFPYDETLPIVKFEPEGLTFLKDVEIGLPYNSNIQDITNLAVMNYVLDPEKIVEMPVVDIDQTKKVISCNTDHFSYYLAWDKDVGLDVQMLKINGKIGVKLHINGYSNNRSELGFKWIRTTRLHSLSGHFNAWTCLTSSNHDDVYSLFRVRLYEYKISGSDGKGTTGYNIRRSGGNNYTADILGSNSSVIHSTENLIKEDIISSKDYLTTWFSGAPLIYKFDDFNPDSNDKYFIKVEWVLSPTTDGWEVTNFSPIFEFNTKKNRMLFNDMASYSNDSNNNGIDDDYEPEEPEKPSISINTIEAISNNSVKVTSTINDDGGASITKRGVYWSKNVNPDENDNVVTSGSGDGTFETTITGLETNTNYYFIAYAENEAGLSISGQEHLLTGNTAPQVTINQPATDGDKFQKGYPVTITATASDSDGTIKNVKMYMDNSLIKEFSSAQSSYSFDWNSPNTTVGNHEIKVTVTDDSASSTSTTSVTRQIEIVDGSIQVSTPNTNTVWTFGDQNVNIAWNHVDLDGNVSIDLYKGSNKVVTITNSTPNDGAFNTYDVPTSLAEGTDYRIKITSIEYPDKEDYSSYFDIKDVTNLAPIAPNNPSPIDEAEISGNSQTLTWTCSDPEGDALTYDVYFGTTQSPPLKSSGQTATSYNATDLTEGQTYYWYIIASDNKGNSTQGSLWSFSVLVQNTGQTTYIPDANFEQALIDLGIDADGVINQSVETADISGITSLNVNSKNISNLKGIEDFSSLTELICEGNNLSSLNVDKNTALTLLNCRNNNLSSLNVDKNTALTMLICDDNQLTSLDVSQNTALNRLICYENQLTSLDISQNTALTKLNSNDNQITSLNVSQNTALFELGISNNQLTGIDLNQNTSLLYLSISHNQLTSLDVSKNSALEIIYCADNQLTSLDVSQNSALRILFFHENNLTGLDLSQNTALYDLWCYSNELTNLDVSQNTALRTLLCNSNQLTSLDVSQNTGLKNFNCSSNQLTSLNIKNGFNSILTNFVTYNNPLLTCIQVDDAAWSDANWTSIDSWATFSEDCGY